MGQLEFRGIFDCNESFIGRDVFSQCIQESGLPGPGSTGNQNTDAGVDRGDQEFHHVLSYTAGFHKVGKPQGLCSKTADRQRGVIHGKWRQDSIDPRTVRQPRVHHRTDFINPAADPRNNPLDNPHQVILVSEDHFRTVQLSEPLHIDLVWSVNEDVRNKVVLHQWLKRPQAEHLSMDFLQQTLPCLIADPRSVLATDVSSDLLNFRSQVLGTNVGEHRQVERIHQLFVNAHLELLKAEFLLVDFFARSHPDYPLMNVYFFLAVTSGVAYLAGAIIGGIVVDLAARRSIGIYGYLPAAALALNIPIFLAALWVPDPLMSFLFWLPANLLSGIYVGPTLALAQSLSPARIRALSAAIFFFVVNVIALGLGPTFVGFFASALVNSWGEAVALQIALSSLAVPALLAICAYLKLARGLDKDWKRAS